MVSIRTILCLTTLAVSSLALPQPAAAPFKLPFSTKGRDIIQSDGSKYLFASTNWPGHQEAMIPEGLQYSSVKDIVSKIKAFGLNSVRLTYATQMIDEIYSKGSDTSLEDSLKTGLGIDYGAQILQKVLSYNPTFTANTTRLQVFDAVAKEMADQGLVLHLDNHMSSATWCCGENDGNGWFGESKFNVNSWIRGWKYIAAHAAKNWPSFSSAGLRNELRNAKVAQPYDWYTWHLHMTAAAAAVHEVAPNALIFFSGLNYDTTIRPLPLGQTLNGTTGTATAGKTAVFNPNSYAYKNKIVLEIHKYDFEKTQDNCTFFGSKWYNLGFQALNASDPVTKYTFPVVISEWGFIQNGLYYRETTYNKCLIEFVNKWKVSWMQWDVAGSYYVRKRNGATTLDDDEAWGLLNHGWNATRSQVTVDNSLTKMIQALA